MLFRSVRKVDGYLGTILQIADGVEGMRGRTAIVLTADHGGIAGATEHSLSSHMQTYTIPLYLWGAGIAGGDLYAMNSSTRRNPQGDRPLYSASPQPIRNGDVANLALGLLRLGPVPGSHINTRQDLRYSP